MSYTSILIVVDALGASASGDLAGNVYLVDTNRYICSWLQGTSTLHTVCEDGQTLGWRVTSVSPGNDVRITGFSGAMTSGKVCQPVSEGVADDAAWAGRVESRGSPGSFPYVVAISIDGAIRTFEASIKVV